MSSIDLEFYLYHNTPMIDVRVWRNTHNDYKKISMIFDTGAYLTTISSYLADILCYAPIGKKTHVGSVGGTKEAYYSVIPDLKFGDFSFGAIAALVIDFSEDIKSDAVLGMNLIKHFNTSIIFEEGSQQKGIIKLQPRFSLDEIKTADDFDYQYSRFGIWNINKTN